MSYTVKEVPTCTMYDLLLFFCLQQLSKQTDFTVRQVERWFRVRRNQDRPSMMARFTEAA
jgi:hypothetical protein